MSKSKTVLITGSSSGIGKAAAIFFAQKGWNVAATMRNPTTDHELAKIKNVRLYKLDVTDEASIKSAITSVITDFSAIEVIVNNAGYGAIGIFEKASRGQIQKQFDTNLFGVMNVIREILPYFRKKSGGTIINITSMGGLITFPIYSLYHGTKWALEGFSEALLFEVKQFNIKIKLVEPGAIKTDFYDRSQELFKKEGLSEYDNYEKVTFANSQNAGATAPGPEVVAKVIYKAANSNSFRLRYPVGGQAPLLLFLRRILPNSWFFAMVRMVVEKGFKK
jgi:NAD(P)-dependent dehydrogenase (short-subunit alcohol dehydrogenase family)